MADSVPSTWEEPRGPHLPDAVTGIGLPVWAFVAAAAVTAILELGQITAIWDTGTSLTVAIGQALRFAASVAFPLWGAAFLWRHPDGWRSARLIAIGAVLAAVYSLLEPVRSAIVMAVGFGDDFDRLVLVSLVMGSISSGVGIAAVAAIAVGLQRARRGPDGEDSMRGLSIVLVLVSLTTALLGLVVYRGIELTALNIAALATNTVLEACDLLAWSALIVIALAGWLADERPARAWLLGAGAGAAALVGQALLQTVQLLATGSTTGVPPGYEAGLWISLLAPVLLLVAFAFGLPSTAETAWVDLEGRGAGDAPVDDAPSVAVAGE